MSQPYTAPTLVIHAWAMGRLANYWMAGVLFSLLSVIFTLTFKMDPVKVGFALMLPRLIDMVIDPLLGRLSDNTHTRWGRRRPFIFVATILGAILSTVVWWMPPEWAADWRGFAFLTTMATLLYANFGMHEMAHNALGYELTDDYQQRSRVQALGAFWFSIGGLGGGWFYWLAQRPYFGTGSAGEIAGLHTLSFGIGAIILIAGLLSCFVCKERFANANRKHVNIWQALKETLSNRPFVVILLIRVINTFGQALFGSISVYLIIYGVYAGDKGLYNEFQAGWNGVAAFILGYIMVWVAAPITKLIDKRKGLILAYAFAAINACLAPFIIQPGNMYVLFWVGILFAILGAVGANFMASVMPDICDLDEYEHGERREGLFAAVMSFVSKLESSLCLGIGGLLLAKTGFDATLPQQTPEVISNMRLYAFTPAIATAIICLVIICFFPLGRERMAEIRAGLDARRAAKAGPT